MDDYCEAQNYLKNSSAYKNVYNTLFLPVVIDSYLEKHKIFDIIAELMMRIAIERPKDIIDYMITKLIEISVKFERNVVKIEFNNCKDDDLRMLKQLSSTLHIPLIEYINDDNSTNDSKKDLNKIAWKALCNHHIIIFDIKKGEDENVNDKGKFLRIINANNSDYMKSHKCNLSNVIELKFCRKNLKRAIEVVRYMKPQSFVKVSWNYRALIVGRVGSGRKTQAAMLANEFGLIYIDLDYMIVEYETKSRVKHEMSFWGFVQEALLKPHCLRNGYAVVSNVISREYLKILMEKFIHPPNQIIFLHANEKICRERISKREDSYHHATTPVNMELFLNYQMNLYEKLKMEFIGYFRKDLRDKIYHINGNGSIDVVKDYIWGYLNNFSS